MKQKVGKCIDCPPDSPDKPITAGRCNRHYWPYRASVNAQKQSAKDKVQGKKELNVFFASQMLEIPRTCENCGYPLNLSSSWEIRKQTAHILAKSKQNGFPNLATHPLNRMFLCCDTGNYCHGRYDSSIEARKSMNVYNLAIERFNAFKSLLNQSELQKAKKYLGIE